MFNHDVTDDKLRLRKLIRVLDRVGLILTLDRRRRRSLLRTRVMLSATLILRENGNRRAQNHQRGGALAAMTFVYSLKLYRNQLRDTTSSMVTP